jgi:hypothetical protein
MTNDAALLDRIQALTDEIELRPGYRLRVQGDHRGVFIQIQCWRPDTTTNVYDWGYGGKYYVSQYAIDSEIISACYGLYEGYDRHECRESFKWRGRRIFGPHIDVQALWTVAETLDVRPAPPIIQEDIRDDRDPRAGSNLSGPNRTRR